MRKIALFSLFNFLLGLSIINSAYACPAFEESLNKSLLVISGEKRVKTNAAKTIQAQSEKRLYDPGQRKAITKIDLSLGKKRQVLLNKYNPSNIHHLNHRDATYLAGLAQIIEKEVKLGNKGLSATAIQLKTKKILDEMVNSCNKKRN